jgi:hypothetical protein
MQQLPYIPPPSYRKAPPPFRERVRGFARGLGNLGLGDDAVPPSATPVEVIDGAPELQPARPVTTIDSFLQGQPGSGVRLLTMTALRSVFIFPGLWLVNSFSPKENKLSNGQMVVYSLAGSSTITLGMLGWNKLDAMRRGRSS